MSQLTAEEIAEFLALEEERKALTRKADTLSRKAGPLKEKLMAFVRDRGGKDRTCLTHGFTLSLKEIRGAVAWKDEFLKVSSVEEAEKISANAPTYDRLFVEKAATP